MNLQEKFEKLLDEKADEIYNEYGGYEDGHIESLYFKLNIWRQVAIDKLSWEEAIKKLEKEEF